MSCPSEKDAKKKGKGSKEDKAPVPAKKEEPGGDQGTAGTDPAESGESEKNEAGEGEKLTTPEPTKEPEETKKGFRPECYEMIEKNITADTKMVVVKLRYRLGDNTNVVVGDEFTASQMDARILLGAMNSFHIVPVEHRPLEGEHRQVFVNRMMKIYLPDVAPSTCGKKNA